MSRRTRAIWGCLFAAGVASAARAIVITCNACVQGPNDVEIVYGDPVDCKGQEGHVGCKITIIDNNGDGKIDSVENDCAHS